MYNLPQKQGYITEKIVSATEDAMLNEKRNTCVVLLTTLLLSVISYYGLKDSWFHLPGLLRKIGSVVAAQHQRCDPDNVERALCFVLQTFDMCGCNVEMSIRA